MNFQPYEALRRPVDKDLAALADLYKHNKHLSRERREAKAFVCIVIALTAAVVLIALWAYL